ncbi:MAG: sulfurase [Rhodobacterales bacterium]|nr:MAG: sulfurase [Rhodobacterales bacterium]
MPALLPTDFSCRIVWLGYNADREQGLENVSARQLTVGFGGAEQDSRYGLTRPSCGRLQRQFPRGTTVRNTRQFCIMSAEELGKIAENMGVAALKPEWLGCNIVVQGLPDLSHLPPSSRLISTSGTGLCVDLENRPCHLPAKVIEQHLPGKGGAFKTAAKGLRGVTAWVEREGVLQLGDVLVLHVPDQPIWPHLDRARGL